MVITYKTIGKLVVIGLAIIGIWTAGVETGRGESTRYRQSYLICRQMTNLEKLQHSGINVESAFQDWLSQSSPAQPASAAEPQTDLQKALAAGGKVIGGPGAAPLPAKPAPTKGPSDDELIAAAQASLAKPKVVDPRTTAK